MADFFKILLLNIIIRTSSLFQHRTVVNKFWITFFLMHRVLWRTVKRRVGVLRKSEVPNNFLKTKLQG